MHGETIKNIFRSYQAICELSCVNKVFLDLWSNTSNSYFYAMAVVVFSKKSLTCTCNLALKTLNIHHGMNKMLIAKWLSSKLNLIFIITSSSISF